MVADGHQVNLEKYWKWPLFLYPNEKELDKVSVMEGEILFIKLKDALLQKVFLSVVETTRPLVCTRDLRFQLQTQGCQVLHNYVNE